MSLAKSVSAVAAVIFVVACAAGWICLRLARLDRGMWRLETFVFSAGVGLIFGMYPAVRAARLDPVDAIRHE